MRVEVLGRVATMQVKINEEFAMLETIVVANAESRHLDPFGYAFQSPIYCPSGRDG